MRKLGSAAGIGIALACVWLAAGSSRAPATLQMHAADAAVIEGQTLQLRVSRGGDTRGAVSVEFRTLTGSADADDYAAASGRLQWADGDGADKLIDITTRADGRFEEDEQFGVALSAPGGGARLGALDATTVTLSDNDPVPLQLLALNDFHGNLEPPGGVVNAPDPDDAARTVALPAGGVEYLSTRIQQLRAANPRTTVVAAGDLIGASPLISALFHDEPSIEAMNRLGLEYSSLGNHEFDDGSAEVLRMQRGGCVAGDANSCVDGRFGGARFQYLAANVIDHASGRSFMPGYAIKRIAVGGGRQIGLGFIGAVLRDTPGIVTRSGVAGLDFTDEANAVNALVPVLKAAGVEAIVLLIHEGGSTTGLYNDKSCPGLSGDVLPIVDRLDPAIRVVVSGHTHRAYNCVRQGRVLSSAGAYGRFLTRMDFLLDRSRRDLRVVRVDNEVAVNDTAPNPAPQAYPTLARDPGQTAIVARYRSLAAPQASRVVGSLAADIGYAVDAAGESALGDLIADAQLAATQAPEDGGAVVAFMNPGGIRANLLMGQISMGEQPGQLTYGEAFAAQPFGDALVTLTLSGAQIKTLLEQQFAPVQAWPRVLQVSSGFAYRYDLRRPAGSRVDAASIRIAGQPLAADAHYRVAVNSFLAGGGDNFAVLRQATDPRKGPPTLLALTQYVAAHSPVQPGPRGRIARVDAPP